MFPCCFCVVKMLAVGSCWETHVHINISLTFISNLFGVSLAGSLNTVSHFLELSSGCGGFVLF